MVAGFVRWEDLNRNTHWGVIILFGATISLGFNIKQTGAALWLANEVIKLFGSLMDSFPFLADSIVVLITTILANVLSSSATVAVLGPITLNMGDDAMHLGLVTVIASAFGYFTAVAAPACTIIYSSGMVKAKDFLKVGWKVGLISMIILVIYANTYWMIFN
jgi:sodium-dependent dicarboxylate transporter 2/3/5